MMAEEHKKLRPKKKLIRVAFAFTGLLSGSIAWMGLTLDQSDPIQRTAQAVGFWTGLFGFILIMVLSQKTVRKQGKTDSSLFGSRERMLSMGLMAVLIIAMAVSESLLHYTGATFLFLALFTFTSGIFLMQGEMFHIHIWKEKRNGTHEKEID